MVFRNAVSGHPVCAAYRASLFTGKYTTSTGMVINELRLNTNHVFLAQVLKLASVQEDPLFTDLQKTVPPLPIPFDNLGG